MADIADYAAPALQVEQTKSQESTWIKRLFGSFLFRRVFRALLTIFFVSTMIFFLLRLLPGSPVDVYINQQMTQYGYSYDEAKNQALSLYAIDVDKPVIAQYFDYMKNLAQGDLGMSLTSPGTSVATIIQSRIWWTIFSVGTALILSFAIGVLLGMVMAYKRNSWVEGGLSGFASITHSIPNYLLAILIIVTFGVRLGWIPFTDMRGAISPGQQVEFSFAFFKDVFYHASLAHRGLRPHLDRRLDAADEEQHDLRPGRGFRGRRPGPRNSGMACPVLLRRTQRDSAALHAAHDCDRLRGWRIVAGRADLPVRRYRATTLCRDPEARLHLAPGHLPDDHDLRGGRESPRRPLLQPARSTHSFGEELAMDQVVLSPELQTATSPGVICAATEEARIPAQPS